MPDMEKYLKALILERMMRSTCPIQRQQAILTRRRILVAATIERKTKPI